MAYPSKFPRLSKLIRLGRLLPRLAAIAPALAATACDTLAPATLDPQQAAAYKTEGPVRLASGDKLRVTVFEEDKLTGDYEVDVSGNIALPLAGLVKAAGLTPVELEQSIAGKLKGNFLRSPKVTVSVLTFRPFYILGEVEKPGEYPYRPGLNVMSALAVAGGQTYRASNSKVMIQRAGTTTFQEVPISPAVPVGPGDLVRVPERYF